MQFEQNNDIDTYVFVLKVYLNWISLGWRGLPKHYDATHERLL